MTKEDDDDIEIHLLDKSTINQLVQERIRKQLKQCVTTSLVGIIVE